MADYKVVDAQQLDAGMTATANAIRKKAGRTTPIAWDSANGFKTAVEEITAGTEIPELTNPGDASDLAAGKELIDQNGNVVTGTVQVVSSDLLYGATSIKELNDLDGDPSVRVRVDMSSDSLMRKNSRINAYAKLPEFGNAQPSQVVKGATFTSAAGLLVEGTVQAPTSYGLYLADEVEKQGSDAVRLVFPQNYLPIMFKNGFSVCARLTEFGDAAASDVAKGKTFTSAAGLQVEGTLETGSGGVHMSVDGETLVITGAVTIENETLIL